VGVLQIHGTDDPTVLYEGETGSPGYPGAEETAARWAALNGCDEAPDQSAAPEDFSATIEGAETAITRYTGCEAGVGVELWTMNGEGHIPGLNDRWGPAMIDFLFAHSKP
jgi:poly(3-hydroxybutyrate) depolymerase